MDEQQEYIDICNAGFSGTFEDYIKYKSTYGKTHHLIKFDPNIIEEPF